MKRFLFIILLILPYFSYCQLSDDSLEKICIKRYQEEVDSSGNRFKPSVDKFKNYLIFKTVQEPFKGYFRDIRMFVVVYHNYSIMDDGANSFARIYAVDMFTGKNVDFKDKTAFYNFLNSSTMLLSSFDKAYLYLFLYLNILQTDQLGLTLPEFYNY